MQYKPHDYQKFAVDFIETHPQAAVLLECGLGKTSITLTALNDMMFDRFEIRKVLIIAPIRVCRNSWAAEISKWDHLKGLTYSLVLGNREQRLAALRKKADLYIINRENVQWLIESSGMPFDFNMVVIDELSSFKNHQSKRFRQLLVIGINQKIAIQWDFPITYEMARAYQKANGKYLRQNQWEDITLVMSLELGK